MEYYNLNQQHYVHHSQVTPKMPILRVKTWNLKSIITAQRWHRWNVFRRM